MTNHKFTALDFFVIQDTLLETMRYANGFGHTTQKAREKVLQKIENILYDMNVEVLTDTPDATTVTADTGI